MANTLKFGNGEWYGKKDTILAYNDENSNYKPLPFSFTRASSGTVINKDGLIETVSSGEPRIDYLDNTAGSLLLEPQRTNLITQSEAFGNSYWTKSGASIQGDASTAGSELITVLADRDFSSDTGFWTKSAAWTISGGKLNVNGSLDTGTGTSCWRPSFLTVGKTYQITFTISNYVSGSLAVLQEDGGTYYTSNGTFTQTFQAVSTGLGFNRSLSFGGITNMSIDNVSVKEVQGFASPSADTPLGAFKLAEDTSTSSHYITRNITGTNTSSYSFSVLAKASEKNLLVLKDGTIGTFAYFNLTTGIIDVAPTSTSTAKIESISDGWYRCSLTFIQSGTTVRGQAYLSDSVLGGGSPSYTGDGTSGVYIYGAQVEESSHPTSYIKTEGSTVTRLGEEINNNNNLMSGLNDMAMFIDYELPNENTSAFRNQLGFRNNSNGNFYVIQFPSSNTHEFRYTGIAGVNVDMTPSISEQDYGLKRKLLFTKTGTTLKVFCNGVEVSTVTSASATTFNPNSQILNIGANYDVDMNVNNFKLYNNGFTDQEAIALTS